MNYPVHRDGVARFWAVSVLLVAAVEVAVGLYLFLPQSRAIDEANQHKQDIERRLKQLRQVSTTLGSLRSQADQAADIVAGLRSYADRGGQRIIMEAISEAAGPSGVVVLALAPRPPRAGEDVAALSGSWLLQCSGNFKGLVAFLSRVERPGVLLGVGDFRVDAGKGPEIQMEISLNTLRPVSASGGAGAPPTGGQ